MENNTLTYDLQTLAERWGDWKTPIRAVGGTPMDIRALQMMQDDMYYVPPAGRLQSAVGYAVIALLLPVCTFADLDRLVKRPMGRYTLKGLVAAYAATGGKITTSHTVIKSRKKGKVTAEMVRFLSFCARYL